MFALPPSRDELFERVLKDFKFPNDPNKTELRAFARFVYTRVNKIFSPRLVIVVCAKFLWGDIDFTQCDLEKEISFLQSINWDLYAMWLEWCEFLPSPPLSSPAVSPPLEPPPLKRCNAFIDSEAPAPRRACPSQASCSSSSSSSEPAVPSSPPRYACTQQEVRLGCDETLGFSGASEGDTMPLPDE